MMANKEGEMHYNRTIAAWLLGLMLAGGGLVLDRTSRGDWRAPEPTQVVYVVQDGEVRKSDGGFPPPPGNPPCSGRVCPAGPSGCIPEVCQE
jgi:hypothetical protein